jgi:hypothetical protein
MVYTLILAAWIIGSLSAISILRGMGDESDSFLALLLIVIFGPPILALLILLGFITLGVEAIQKWVVK